jgi:hypothetical protein
MIQADDFMAQWIRRWSTKPEILGSIPSEVVLYIFSFHKNFEELLGWATSLKWSVGTCIGGLTMSSWVQVYGLLSN